MTDRSGLNGFEFISDDLNRGRFGSQDFFLVLLTAILATVIRMMNQTTAWLAAPDRDQQGIAHPINLHPAGQ
jgi:hypothetical protein